MNPITGFEGRRPIDKPVPQAREQRKQLAEKFSGYLLLERAGK